MDQGGRSAGFWVSDVDGLVRISKHDDPRLRLRIGLRSEDVIELDARSLPDDPVPLVAPHGINDAAPAAGPANVPIPSEPPPVHGRPGHLLRFARIGVLPQDADITATVDQPRDPSALRCGVLLEVEQIWQSLGSQAGDVLYSVSLGPGDEAKVAVSDGRWRKKPDTRDRPLRIVAKMVAARCSATASRPCRSRRSSSPTSRPPRPTRCVT